MACRRVLSSTLLKVWGSETGRDSGVYETEHGDLITTEELVVPGVIGCFQGKATSATRRLLFYCLVPAVVFTTCNIFF
jgi:hypothetical protein